MKIRRINRTTEQEPDTYTLQITFSAADIKNAFLKWYGEGIAKEWWKCTLDEYKEDIARFLSVTDYHLEKHCKLGDWGVRLALSKGYLIPCSEDKDRYKVNKHILTLKSGRTSAAVEKLLDD